MCMSVLPVYIYECHVCAWYSWRPEEETLDPLGPEFQTVISCHAGAGNQT